MDRFWDAAADFLKTEGRTQVVAPPGMHALHPLMAAYANVAREDAPRADALVLHKGLYRELAPDFLCAALARLHPAFANEVFIILTPGGALAPDHPHAGDLPAIRDWAQTAAPAQRLPQRTGRMAPVYLGKGQVLCETAGGHLMVLAADDRSITPCMLRDGYFDAGITLFLTRVLRPGMSFLDAGANMGVYAVLAAGAIGPRGRLLAVEANPDLAELVQANFLINGLQGYCRVAATALAGEAGERVLHCFARLKGSSTLLPHIAAQALEQLNEKAIPITVPARPLAMVAQEADLVPDWIKMDIEGAEAEVLRASRAWLLQHRPSLLLEWNRGAINGQEDAFLRLLTDELRYDLQRIGPDGQTVPVTAEELMRLQHCDLAARPAQG